MTIPSFKILKKNASEALAASEHANKIVMIYAGIITALAILVTVVNHTLRLQIAQTGGLSNMGLRTTLTTIQTLLPMLQSFIAMCLELGYMAAMLRIARRQYASHRTLKLGFDRFWVLLRFALLQSGIYMLYGFAAVWIAAQVFVLTPLSGPLMELLTPYVSDASFTPDLLLQDPALADQVIFSMLPMLAMFGVIYLILWLPVSYSLRMGKYVIIDQPAHGAMYAISESKKMMKGSRMRLFKLDLSLWWWYAISIGSVLLCYGDMILPLLGIELPWSAEFSYFLFYGLFLAVQFGACWFLRSRVEVVYAQAYNALKPREKETGVVLGNIFQM